MNRQNLHIFNKKGKDMTKFAKKHMISKENVNINLDNSSLEQRKVT